MMRATGSSKSTTTNSVVMLQRLMTWSSVLLGPCYGSRHGSAFVGMAKRSTFRLFSPKAIQRTLPLSSMSSPPSSRYYTSTSRWMLAATGAGGSSGITHVGLSQMQEIMEDYEEGGRMESQYCIIDVRTEEEVYATGKLGENVYTLPVQAIQAQQLFSLDPDEFQRVCQFEKPTLDETIVFTCAAGMRSVMACQLAAAQGGYSQLINYTGGANEWFSPANKGQF